MKAFQGVIFGLVLFVASFAVIYWNEGRVDLSDIAKTATVIESDNLQANVASEGQLISTSGIITAEPQIGDDLYLKSGTYLQVQRHVEVYAWIEESQSVTKTDSTGAETTTTEYSYSLDWVKDPAASKDFHVPEGHTNVTPELKDVTRTPDTARIGQYTFAPKSVVVPDTEMLRLTADKVSLTANATLESDAYIYVRESTTGTYAVPQLGDLRVSYSVVTLPLTGTVMGELHGTSIDPFVSKKGVTLYRVFDGTHDQAVAEMHGEYKSALWAFRMIGFLMMWFGLWALFGPLSAVMSFIPVVGGVGKAVIGVAAFSLAFVLSAVAIIISAFLHSLLAMAIVSAVIIAGAIGSGVMLSKRTAATQAAVTTK